MMEKQESRQFERGERTPQSYEQSRLLALNLRKGAETGGSDGYWNADLEYGDPTSISRAVAYSKLGNADEAFKYLEKAITERNSGMVWLKVLPELDGIRSDARYQDILRRVGFEN